MRKALAGSWRVGGHAGLHPRRCTSRIGDGSSLLATLVQAHPASSIQQPLSCLCFHSTPRRRLVGLQAQLARMQADADHTLAEVLPLQHALDEIDAER